MEETEAHKATTMDKGYARRLSRYERALRAIFLNALRLQIRPYKELFFQDGVLPDPEKTIERRAFEAAYIEGYSYVGSAEIRNEYGLQHKSYEKSRKDFSLEDGLTVVFDVLRNAVIQFAFSSYGLMRDRLNRTTVNMINDYVQKGRENGLTDEQIARTLWADLENAMKQRSRVLASTEASTIMNYSREITARQFFMQRGVTGYKTWITRNDERVRNTHREVDMRTLPIDAKFLLFRREGGTEFADRPCDIHLSAGNRVNCRCFCFYHSDPNLFRKKEGG